MRHLMMGLALAVVASPLAAQETRFSHDMSRGDRLELENINGDITVTRGSGRTAEIVITKRVKSGNGDMVKAIMEEGSGFVRVCTIYLNRDADRDSCRGGNSTSSGRGRSERLDVEMTYEVRVPAGVRVEADNVNGNVTITGVDATAHAATVNGNIDFDGTGASSFETINGNITANFTSDQLDGPLSIETINGRVDLTFPAGLNADVRGESLSGEIDSDYPMTIQGRWGPKTFNGTIGNGGPRISIETINGTIKLHRQ